MNFKMLRPSFAIYAPYGFIMYKSGTRKVGYIESTDQEEQITTQMIFKSCTNIGYKHLSVV